MLRLSALTCGAVLLGGAAWAAPVALFDTTGTLSFSATGGLVINGNLTAEYNGAPNGTRPYIFHAALSSPSGLTVTPNVSVITPDLSYTVPRDPICTPFGCIPNPLPPITIPIPSQEFSFDLPIPLLPGTTLFDETYVSDPIPLGDVLNFDFGSFLFGQPLSFDDLVQDQFSLGATDLSIAGGVGPFGGSLDYTGTLLGNTVTASYTLTLTASDILAQLEGYALDALNDNLDLFTDLVMAAFMDSSACSGPLGGILCGLVGNLPIGGDDGLQFAVNSLGNFSSDFHFTKSITPAPIPLPAGGLLLLGGLGLLGVAGARRRGRRDA